jgi:hypothetical protein
MARAARPVDAISLGDLIGAADRDVQEAELVIPIAGDEDEPEVLHGKITKSFQDNRSFEQFAGYTEETIARIVEDMTEFALNARKRGPWPRSSVSDMLLCYLTLLRTDADMPKLSKILNLSVNRLSENIARIRPILNAAMKKHWAPLLPRPHTQLNRHYQYAALIIDVTTTQCYRPEGVFEHSKHYYDGKNRIYGLKTEVAVTACAPHLFVRASPHYPGAVHDFTIHKQEYAHYVDFLQKRPEERDEIVDVDPNAANWAVIADKGYIGPANLTPGVRRITPMRKPLLQAERQSNQIINRARVPIEQFFGRLRCKFPLFRNTYRFDHSNFNVDFENACYLINEDILHRALTEQDGVLYNKFLARLIEKDTTERVKRKLERARYKIAKRQRIEAVAQFVPGLRKD